MKDERNVRRRRTAGFKWQPVAILLAAVLMVLSVPFGLRSARAVDLDSDCSLTVSLTGDVTMADDVKTANVVIDLYRIADATAVKGYDTYDWTMNDGFTSITIDKEIDSDGWKTAAQQAADIVLGTAPDGATEWDPAASTAAIDKTLKVTGTADAQITGLKAGLYLIIAHGSDIAEYATTVTDETAGTTGTATLANSKTYAYKFSPELISLPTKDADENDIINTANPGPWIYDAAATMKPSREVRVGDLEITKILEDYQQRKKEVGENPRLIQDPATFVFEVIAYEDDTQAVTIYHDYVSIVFDSYGTKSVLVEGLPVNSYVVVKEAYHGNYTAYVDQSTTIIANETVGVEFKNTWEDREPGSGSVTNHFEYSENDGWTHTKLTDNTADSSAASDNTTGNQ